MKIDPEVFENVFQVKRRFVVDKETKEVRVFDDFVDIEVEKKGWFGRTKKEYNFRSRYIPLPEALKKLCPEGCVLIDFTLENDRYGQAADSVRYNILIYYGKPLKINE